MRDTGWCPNPNNELAGTLVWVAGPRTFATAGTFLLLLGTAALAAPNFTSLALTLMLGWLLLLGGGIGLGVTALSRRAPGFWGALASAAASVLAGAATLRWPDAGMVGLALVLTTLLAAQAMSAATDSRLERQDASLGLNGVFALTLTAIAAGALPGAGGWMLGLVVGANLLLAGTSFIVDAATARVPV